MSVEAATDSATFAAYLEQVLLPALHRRKPDAVLVMDNLRVHKTAEVQIVLDCSGFTWRDLPAYSPNLNPIGPAWAKVKSALRRVAARTPSRHCNMRSVPLSPASPLRMPQASSTTVAIAILTSGSLGLNSTILVEAIGVPAATAGGE
jgi:transposase